jgi:hypothetical protein
VYEKNNMQIRALQVKDEFLSQMCLHKIEHLN